MTKEQAEQFNEAVRPLMKWLAENTNPHTLVIVTSTDAELVSGEMTYHTEEFLKD